MSEPAGRVRPFRIHVPDEVLDDLRARLRATRWPDEEPVADWSQGAPLAYVQEVCRYWADGYDWRRREAALDGLGNFTTTVDGVAVHFVHRRSPAAGALPLLLLHGWPGSVAEFHKVLGPLADPGGAGGDEADAFHVVSPSMPGFGFSGKPRQTGWGARRIARAWATLMGRLGYHRYGVQGGDWGALVATALGAQHPDRVVGLHLNLVPAIRLDEEDLSDLDEAGRAALARRKRYERDESGYARIQGTRPQTIGYALNDSPAGQAAWILEKFQAWTDCGGHPENALTRDELLDQIMLYWVTGSATSSARLYWESFGKEVFDRITVPTAVAAFPGEIVPSTPRWTERRYQLVRWTDMPRGGHFAALEQPGLLVGDVRAFFGSLR